MHMNMNGSRALIFGLSRQSARHVLRFKFTHTRREQTGPKARILCGLQCPARHIRKDS